MLLASKHQPAFSQVRMEINTSRNSCVRHSRLMSKVTAGRLIIYHIDKLHHQLVLTVEARECFQGLEQLGSLDFSTAELTSVWSSCRLSGILQMCCL